MAEQDARENRTHADSHQRTTDGGPVRRRGGEEPSGNEALDAVHETVRDVLGDAEVDYTAEVGDTPVDEERLQELAEEHGDVITRNPDGTHTVTAKTRDGE